MTSAYFFIGADPTINAGEADYFHALALAARSLPANACFAARLGGAKNNAIATLADAQALAHLVNSAYRGEVSRRGWTTEADLLDGARIDGGQHGRRVLHRGLVERWLHHLHLGIGRGYLAHGDWVDSGHCL